VNYRFAPEAEAEYLDAIAFYESRGYRLGATLIAEFEHAIRLIFERPLAWRQVHESGIRKLGLARYPYTVFYLPMPDGVQVTAFAHNRQRPLYWFARLGGL